MSTPRQAKSPPPDYTQSPVRLFVQERWKQNIWKAVAFASLIFSGWLVLAHTEEQNKLGYAFVAGEDGTVTFGKLRGLSAQSGVYRRFLRNVIQARFTLTPDGLADPEAAEAIFSGAAKEDLRAGLAQWSRRGAKAANLYGIPFLKRIEPLSPNGENPLFRVTGFVLVSGVSAGLAIREEEPYAMVLEMAPNPKLDRDEMVDAPFVVVRTWTAFGKEAVRKAMTERAGQ